MNVVGKIVYFLIMMKKIKKKIPKETSINITTNIDCSSKIGKYCYIGKNVHITKSFIGNYTSIANNVSIGQGEHATDLVSTSSIFYNNEYDDLTKEQCIIGNDVWIGVGAVILRGVKVGDGAVIGANAVVTKDIPSYCIAVGVPARVLRKRLPDEVIERIEETVWWDKDLSSAKKIIDNITLK